MQCKHCNEEITSIDNATNHPCFIGQDIYMDDENNLYTNNVEQTIHTKEKDKQPAIWDDNATLALLSLYEAKIDMLDHPKKKTSIWEAISTDLQQDFGIQMSMDQVRWKINALIKKYKECIDNNSKSGRSLMTFKWFNQMDEILGQQRNAVSGHIVSSKFGCTSKPSTSSASSTSSAKKSNFRSSTSILTELNDSNLSSEIERNEKSPVPKRNNPAEVIKNKKRFLHGSGSNLAKTKVALEKQWLEYVKIKTERDKNSDERQAAILEQKKEMMKLKRKHLILKEQEIEQRNEYLRQKSERKENRHAELIRIEKEKCKLLKQLLKARASDSE